MAQDNRPLISRLKFRGGNLQAIEGNPKGTHPHELVLIGPADTGKTVALSFKAIVIAGNVPNVHAALVRKTYASMKESVVKTYKRLIHGLPVRIVGGNNPEKFVFPNGSEIVLIGLDKPDKLLSSEWDFIQVCQMEELMEGDLEMICSRCTGRGGGLFKKNQVFGDVNPSNSKHWIRTRKSMVRLVTTQKDNPELYDEGGNLTAEGAKRMNLADETLSGVRRQRLLYGIWATAEGVVYELFNPTNNVLVWKPEWGEFKEYIITIDPGFNAPTAIACIGIDGDDHWHVFREFYRTGQVFGNIIDVTCGWASEFEKKCGLKPVVVCDEARPELVADLQLKGLLVFGAKGRVEGSTNKNIIQDGIQLVQTRLRLGKDGRARLTIDPSCINTINEFESYVWKKSQNGSIIKDQPEDKDNHIMDGLRYAVVLRGAKQAYSSADGFVNSAQMEQLVDNEWLSVDDIV